MSRKGINGSRKGKGAEREVAALIQAWWECLEPGCRFVRTPQSGGWGTPELRGEFKAAGDLMTTSHQFPFTVEVKKRENWNLERLLAGKTSPAWAWWQQVLTAASEERRIPMLWFRKNRMQWHVLVPWSLGLPDVEAVKKWTNVELGAINYVRLPHCYLASNILALDPRALLPRRKSHATAL